MDYFIQANQITRAYEDKIALDNFNISIPKGSIYGILGPNGAGKTTFIRILNQITRPDTGTILFNGEPLQPKHIAKIGYMPEERGLYKNMKVSEQILYFARLKGMTKKQALQKIDYWFSRLQMEEWAHKKLGELSKGMGQKVQFIVTVIHDPSLLIFDEPFSGFDPINANKIRDEILELKKKGTTIIFSSHRMESVEELCDYVALINKSKKILDGSVTNLKNQFKEGKFRVKIGEVDPAKFRALEESFSIFNLSKENNEYTFTMKKPANASELWLEPILSTGKLEFFYEEIPTMNEVFIKAINS